MPVNGGLAALLMPYRSKKKVLAQAARINHHEKVVAKRQATKAARVVTGSASHIGSAPAAARRTSGGGSRPNFQRIVDQYNKNPNGRAVAGPTRAREASIGPLPTFQPPDPYAPIKQFDYNGNAPGGTYSTNASMAPRFNGLLRDLDAQGYPIKDLGSYAPRMQRGSSTRKSLHSYGLALDINAQQNPMGPTLVTDMPPNISQLAHKYGLDWGGDWNTKKDAMHFSYPMFGSQ